MFLTLYLLSLNVFLLILKSQIETPRKPRKQKFFTLGEGFIKQ